PATAGRAPGRRCRRAGTGPRRDGQRGAVTAETAVVLPTLVVFLLSLLWALLAVAAHIQCVDAARAGARAAARQDPPDAVVETALQAAPEGADVTVGRTGDLVQVEVRARTPGLGALTVGLHARAVASAEETVGADAPVDAPGAGEAAGTGLADGVQGRAEEALRPDAEAGGDGGPAASTSQTTRTWDAPVTGGSGKGADR
ncbi:TadE family type IV pilus minor pilin, partial [Streptomyces sp. SID8014]|uniref:TadE family type IV pilus minor pilin n=1 Tax=Streptomyces sp. SID8014 TaxID=2706097 RepID=UPI0031BB498C